MRMTSMISSQARAAPLANTSKTLNSSLQTVSVWPCQGAYPRPQLSSKVKRAWTRCVVCRIAELRKLLLILRHHNRLRARHLQIRRLVSKRLMRAVKLCAYWRMSMWKHSINMAPCWQWRATCKTSIADRSIYRHRVLRWTLAITHRTQRWALSHLRNQSKRSKELQARCAVRAD